MSEPKQKPGCLPVGFDSNSILTLGQCAVWLQLCEKVVSRRVKMGTLPAMRRGQSYRFHVGTVLATQTQQTKGKK